MSDEPVEKSHREGEDIRIEEVHEVTTTPHASGLARAFLIITGVSVAIAFLYLLPVTSGAPAGNSNLPAPKTETVFDNTNGQKVAAGDAAAAVDEAPKDGDVVEMVAGDTPVLGKSSAPVLVVEWGDYLCPFTARFYEQVESQLREQYIKTGKVRFAYRDFTLHDKLEPAFATRCADEQGKYWEYRDKLFEDRLVLDNRDDVKGEDVNALFVPENLKRLARELGLNGSKFDACLDSGKYAEAVAVEQDVRILKKLNGTPTTFVNGRVVNGAQPFEEIAKVIDEELAK